MLITSTSNPHIKAIRKLRERKEREISGLFYAEGLRLVGEALQLGWEIEELIFSPELLISSFGHELVGKAGKNGIPILEVAPDVFRFLSLKDGPQGLAVLAKQKRHFLDTVNRNGGLWIGLEGIQDSGNLGTIMRTADSVGAEGVILIDHSIDPFDPSVVRASMGAIFSQQIVSSTGEDFISWTGESGYPIVGTSDKSSIYYRNYKYTKSMILLMGSEQKGLSENLRKTCNNIVSIPMVGRSDSLNVSIATGVILYEVFEQTQRRSSPGEKG